MFCTIDRRRLRSATAPRRFASPSRPLRRVARGSRSESKAFRDPRRLRASAMMRGLEMTTLRILFKSPGYLLACVVVLGLGIGGNAAIFSLIDAVILEPLPYPEVNRLVFVWQ